MTQTTSSADTTNDGNHQTDVKVSKVFFLRVIIYYIKKGDNVFKEAAEFLQARLKAQFPEAKNNKILKFPVTTAADFKNVWTQINTLSRDGVHLLKRVHYLGHGGETAIYCLESRIGVEDVTSLPELNWHPDSVLVLHACKTGHEYETKKREKVECIARKFSEKQKIRVVGQIVGANFSQEQATREYALFSKRSAYLWAYCSGKKTRRFVTDPNSIGYNLYEEYKQLAYQIREVPTDIHDSMSYEEIMKAMEETGYYYVPSGKVWACQMFHNDEALSRNLNDISIDLSHM